MLGILSQLAIISIPTVFFLHSVSRRSTLGRYYIRLTIYLSTLSLCAVYGALVSIALTLVGQRFEINWVVARTFYSLASRALGIRYEVEGEHWVESSRPAVFVGNHQSMLDILYLGRIFPHRGSIVTKKELRWAPFLGQYLMASGAVFVERANSALALRSLAEAGHRMKSRRTSLWLFPEGTRSLSVENKLLPFKKGAFHLAVQIGLPIVPVVCENYSHLYGPGKLESGDLKIRVLEPIPTTNLTIEDIPELAVRTHNIMEIALREISRHSEEPVGSIIEPLSSDIQSSSSREGIHEMKREGREAVELKRQDGSEAGSIVETGSTGGTESDEGMVLVGRPT